MGGYDDKIDDRMLSDPHPSQSGFLAAMTSQAGPISGEMSKACSDGDFGLKLKTISEKSCKTSPRLRKNMSYPQHWRQLEHF